MSASARSAETSADVDPGSLLTRLVRRITFGPDSSQIALATALGYEGYLEHQLNHLAIADPASDARLASLTTLTQSVSQLFALNNSSLVGNELIEATIVRAHLSQRQLFERMVEFWTDHFSIFIDGLQVFKAVDDRDVIRAHALGSFPMLLNASAHSPAMLVYLNNNTSVVGNPNENYARELMELHTLGVNGGYTQQDVEEVARCFTGWTFWDENGPNGGEFRFRSEVHDTGEKIVLGQIIPAGGGIEDGHMVLDILATHPATARRIAHKMCVKFLGESVPERIIDRVAGIYTSTAGDIKAMLREVLKPAHLYDSPLRLKRPFHLMMSALRAIPTTINSTSSMRSQLRQNGHLPFDWITPDGYPDTFEHWGSQMLPRWNFAVSMMIGGINGVSAGVTGFFAGLTTVDQMLQKINTDFFQGEMPQHELRPIHEFLLANPFSLTRQREALSLAASTSSFQWY